MKGFLFYVYQPLVLPDPVLDGDAESMKKTMVDGNALLRDMEPFIMSDIDPVKYPVNVTSGNVAAWKFTDDAGNIRIAVISLSPGDNAAEIELPAGMVPSWGNAKVEGSKAVFAKKNIGCELFVVPRH